ncbi:DMT family transporter [Stappia sp. 28M-7]|uniref:DMT family transporter n=1 Tax=Stappia sp. 28M-7 TaxID=2762596 RepID=UPI001AD8EF9D
MRAFFDKAVPGIFVLLWSTGFIGSKLGAPHIEPFVFLTIRFALVLPVMLALAIVLRAHWPRRGSEWAHCFAAGVLIHGVYLGGIFYAIDNGMPAGISALFLGLQPLLTALLAGPVLGEKVAPRHWLGLAVGAIGLLLVVGPRIGGDTSGLSMVNVLACLAAAAGIAVGTIYQKRFVVGIDLIPGTLLQYFGALALVMPLSTLEDWQIAWTGELIIAMTWLVLVLSIGAVLLLMVLIKRGSASRVSSLFYLAPVATAVEGYLLFGETLSLVQVVGAALVVGALLIIRERRIGTRRTPA